MKAILVSLLAACLAISPALAKGNGHGHDKHHKHHDKHHKHHDKVIVVKPGHHHHKPKHHHYHHHDIKDVATFAVLAGATYAVIDNVFYKQQGKEYVYVQQPPVGSYAVVTQTNTVTNLPATSSLYRPGTLVTALPVGHRIVTVDGVSYREFQGTWFAPVAASNQFVVVTSPL